MSKFLLRLLLLIVTIMGVLMILELVLPSFNMSEDITLALSAGSGLIIMFTIFSFAADKGKKALCIFGSIMTFILTALLMYLYFSLKSISSFSALNALLTVAKICAGLGLIVELLVGLSLFFIFTRDSFFFNLFKCTAFVSSCILTISVLYPLIMDNNSSSSLLDAKFTTIVGIILGYSIVASIITYIIAAPKEVDKTDDNYYADVRNLTYNQTNVVDNSGVNTQPVQQGTVPAEPAQVVAPVPVAAAPVEAVPATDQPSIEQVFSAHLMTQGEEAAIQTQQPAPVQPVQQPVAAPQPVAQPIPVQQVQQPVAAPQSVAQPAQPVQQVQQPVAAPQPVAQPAPVQPVQQPVAAPQPAPAPVAAPAQPAAPQPVAQPAPAPVAAPAQPAAPQPVAQPAQPVQQVQQPVVAPQSVAQPAPVQPVQQPVAAQPVKEEQVETLDTAPATVVPTVK